MKIEEIKDPKSDVLSEKSLRQVFAKAIFVVGHPRDFWFFVGATLIVSIWIIVARIYFNQMTDPALTAALVQKWTIVLVAMATGILGFLIAGFSIFATVTKPDLFWLLASFREEGRGISQFKFVFFNFMYIFIHYLIYIVITLIANMMTISGSPLWYIVKIIHQKDAYFSDIGVNCFAGFLFSYTIYMLLILRGFVWNLYQSLLISIFDGMPRD